MHNLGSPRTTEHVPGRDQQAPYRSSSKGLRRPIRDVNIWFCIIFDVENDSVSLGTVRLGRSKTRMRFLFKVSYCSICFYYPIFIFCFTAVNDKSLTWFLLKKTQIFLDTRTQSYLLATALPPTPMIVYLAEFNLVHHFQYYFKD